MRTSKLAAGTVALVCCSIAGAAYAGAHPGSRFIVRARPRTIYYHQPTPNAVKIAGQLVGARSGLQVVLDARTWPFHGSFRTVASEPISSGGRFAFVQRPSVATQYRVSAAGARSETRTVYVYPGYANATCFWSGTQGHGSCTKGPRRPGQYTLHFTFDYLYPPALLSREIRLPVFVYFAECFGCSSAPTSLQLQGSVSQSRDGSESALVSITQRFTVNGGQTYYYQLNPCVQTSEHSNGFGLPGRPGSHRCGSSSIPTKYFSHGRQIG